MQVTCLGRRHMSAESVVLVDSVVTADFVVLQWLLSCNTQQRTHVTYKQASIRRQSVCDIPVEGSRETIQPIVVAHHARLGCFWAAGSI
jgi:hypothetical protein